LCSWSNNARFQVPQQVSGVLGPNDAGLHVLAYALPLTHSVQAMRAAMGGDTPARATLSLMALAAFAIVLFALSAWILARRLDHR
jgi:ABC-type polysaccharide/polyol phosphate export permease